MAIGYRSLSALTAIRLNDRTRTALGDTYAQLSSGQRINKPSADPAGLAVSVSLGVETKITGRAKANAEDGISAASYAEAAFDSAEDIITKMTELAGQAANGVLSSTQRGALNTEFAALSSELVRLRKAASFNGSEINNGAAGIPTYKSAAASSSSGLSADGRLLYYIESNQLKMRDLSTDQVTTIAAADGGGLAVGLSVSAAGDKVAYVNGASLYLYDALSGTSSLINPSLDHPEAIQISGDGSTVAIIDGQSYSSEGVLLGGSGFSHLATYDVSTGLWKGDNDAWGFTLGSAQLSLSYNGDYVAVQGNEDSVLGTADEVHVFSTSNLLSMIYHSNNGTLRGKFAVKNNGDVVAYSDGDSTLYAISASNTVGGRLWNGVQPGFFLGLTDGGSSLVVKSTGNYTGENKSGLSQLFKYDLTTGTFRQLTSYSSASQILPYLDSPDAISNDGYTAYSATGRVYDLSPKRNIDIDTGGGAAGVIRVSITALDGAARGLQGVAIDTQFGAKSAEFLLKRVLEGVELQHGFVGAAVSRLGSASRAIAAKGTEQQAAYARITDVDTADAIAKSVRLQVLSEAQTAVIAQSSKLVPETALKLLQAA